MKKDLLIIFVVVLAVIVLINGTEFQTVEEFYLTHAEDITEDSQTVWLEIDCSKAIESGKLSDKQMELQKDRYIVKNQQFVLRDGDTVFDLLKRACRYKNIQMEYQGVDQNNYNSVYIQGINYVYEFDCGEYSGWVFLVNGEQVQGSCGKYMPKDGDRISWVYTLDLGRDL